MAAFVTSTLAPRPQLNESSTRLTRGKKLKLIQEEEKIYSPQRNVITTLSWQNHLQVVVSCWKGQCHRCRLPMT